MRNRAFIVAFVLALLAVSAPVAGAAGFGPHDPWYANAASGEQGVTLITDTLAPGGSSSAEQAPSFITDTLAPGGSSAAKPTASFITDTLAPGGSTQSPSYRLITDTLAPGGGVVASEPSSVGFGWSDAGIGAAFSVGVLALLLATSGLVVRRRRAVAI